MSDKKIKIKALQPLANPSEKDPTGCAAIIKAGTVVELPAFWADRYIAEGRAEKVVKEKAE